MAGTPIIRSPMKPAKKGEAPTLDWAKWVEKTLRRLIDVPPPRQRPITGGSGEKPPLWTIISQVPDSPPEAPVFQATPTLGYLIYQQATMAEQEDESVGWIAPKIMVEGQLVSIEPPSANDTPTDPPWSPPSVELPAMQSWVYLRVKTDADGAPKLDGESVTIEAFDEKQVDIHHVRPSPSGGEEEGDYFFLILETEGDGGDPERPIIRRRITGNRQLPNQLVEITNIGGKRELYQGYLPGPDDKHELRTIEQLITEGGAEIIKPLEEGEEEGDTIKWRNIKKDNDSSVPYTIVGEGDSVKVRMEGTNDPYIDPFGGQVSFASGLATSVQGGAFEGKNLNLTVERFEWYAGGPSGEMIRLSINVDAVHYWRNGIYAGTVAPGDAPADLIEQTVTRMTESG